MGRRLPWICGRFYYCVLFAGVHTLLKIFVLLLQVVRMFFERSPYCSLNVLHNIARCLHAKNQEPLCLLCALCGIFAFSATRLLHGSGKRRKERQEARRTRSPSLKAISNTLPNPFSPRRSNLMRNDRYSD